MRKLNMIEVIPVIACLLFAITISLYHISFEGYFGLSIKEWGVVWAIAENGLSLVMSILLSIFACGILSLLFRWLFIPYFALKLIYYISCYSGIILLSVGAWQFIWSIVLVLFIISSLVYCLYLIKEKNVV